MQRAVGGLKAHTPFISRLHKTAIGGSKPAKCLIQFVPSFYRDNARYEKQ